MSKFVKQKERYQELADQLQQIYTNDSKIVEENEKLKIEVVSLNNKISSSDIELQKSQSEKLIYDNELKRLHDTVNLQERQVNIAVIEGDWNLTIALRDQPENSYKITIRE